MFRVKSGTVSLCPPDNTPMMKSHGGTVAGVWLIHQSTRVDASDIVSNTPSELIIVVPELVAGTYQLEVRTQYSGSKILKEIRTASFDKPLSVR